MVGGRLVAQVDMARHHERGERGVVEPAIAACLGEQGIVQLDIAAGDAPVHSQLHAPRRDRDVVPGVVDECDAIQQLVRGAYADDVLETLGDRRDTLEVSRQYLDLLRSEGVGELHGVCDVPAQCGGDAELLVRVDRLIDLEGVVADAVEPRRPAAVIEALDRKGEWCLAQQPRLKDRIERALDVLLAAADDRPLRVLRGEGENAAVGAPAEVRVVHEIRGDDVRDLIVGIGHQHRRDDAEGGAVVGIHRRERNRQHRPGGGIQPVDRAVRLRSFRLYRGNRAGYLRRRGGDRGRRGGRLRRGMGCETKRCCGEQSQRCTAEAPWAMLDKRATRSCLSRQSVALRGVEPRPRL